MSSNPRDAEETIDIENAGNTVSVVMSGATILSIHIRGDAAATYQVDVRINGGTWIQNVKAAYSGSADYNDVWETGAQEVRIRCSTGTAGAGDSATITLMAGG